ncbi:hypothetical protein F5B20DRAFT_594289 [Whalleya microplaca]|nr:hypothetical protein F5B20DRAFT_594289 [Whalleya microplaca]
MEFPSNSSFAVTGHQNTTCEVSLPSESCCVVTDEVLCEAYFQVGECLDCLHSSVRDQIFKSGTIEPCTGAATETYNEPMKRTEKHVVILSIWMIAVIVLFLGTVVAFYSYHKCREVKRRRRGRREQRENGPVNGEQTVPDEEQAVTDEERTVTDGDLGHSSISGTSTWGTSSWSTSTLNVQRWTRT